MEAFTYQSPTVIEHGVGKRHEIGKILQGRYKKALIVLSKGPFRENGVLDDIVTSLENSGIKTYQFSDIESNPKMSSAREGVKIAIDNDIDVVVAIGGGSALDCGKIIGAAAKMHVDPFDIIWGKRIEVTDSLDVVTVPTFAATGTEVNNAAVMVNGETKEKYWAIAKFPVIALQDPEITASVPLRLTIWGTMDILSHTFEYYFNGYNRSEFQLCLAEALVRSIMKTLEDLVKDPKDLNARSELMWEAVMAWGGITKIGQKDPDMACHSIEESFSGFFDTHHGACLGVLTPNWMKTVYALAPAEFARFGRNCLGILEKDDLKAAKMAVETYLTWLDKIHAPKCYADIAKPGMVITKEGLDHVAEKAWEIYDGHIGHIHELTFDEVKSLLYRGLEPYTI